MSVTVKDLFHGAVLSKLIRKDRPLPIKLIEMDFDQSRSAYLVNIDTYFYIKSSKSPKLGKRRDKTWTWTFTFSPKHITELNDLHK